MRADMRSFIAMTSLGCQILLARFSTEFYSNLNGGVQS